MIWRNNCAISKKRICKIEQELNFLQAQISALNVITIYADLSECRSKNF